jgi:pimeloyl-ACP methyl ester carboxylesterase
VRQQVIDDRVNEWRCGGIGEDPIRKKEKRLRTRLGLCAGLSRVVKIGYLSRIIDYDPAGIASRIRCPILALYGEHDTLFPAIH